MSALLCLPSLRVHGKQWSMFSGTHEVLLVELADVRVDALAPALFVSTRDGGLELLLSQLRTPAARAAK